MARSSQVNTVAFDVQLFISERAQDLTPTQSRRLLLQLQLLQRGFHQALGRGQAWADALSVQREREDERQRRDRAREEEDQERERQRAREREVWTQEFEPRKKIFTPNHRDVTRVWTCSAVTRFLLTSSSHTDSLLKSTQAAAIPLLTSRGSYTN